MNCEISNETLPTTLSDETTLESTVLEETTTFEPITIAPCVNDTDDCSGHYICNGTIRVCLAGWTGDYCTKRDFQGPFDLECPVNGGACKNGGTCSNGGCCCRPGFTGDLCGIDIKECDSDPCLNGGVCFDLENYYECYCQPGNICFLSHKMFNH